MAQLPQISSHLAPGMESPDVKALQQFLNANGYIVAESGLGSPGNETMYFGPGTQAALQRFQADKGIVNAGSPGETGFGALGPRTLAQVNSMMTAAPTASGVPAAPVNTAAIGQQYGYEPHTQALNKVVASVDGFFNLLKSGAIGETPLSERQIEKVINNPTLVGFYLNALTYGGYSIQDMYKDILWRNTGAKGPEPISDSIEAPIYKASDVYDQVRENPDLAISPTIAGLDSSVLTLPALQMPDDAFRNVVPLTPEQLRDEAEKYKSATYESAMAMATANNEAEHTRALSDWKSLKEQISTKLGLTLSDNAVAAWNQISNFVSQAATNGIAGSGIVDQKVDAYLRQQKRVNDAQRSVYKSTEDQGKAAYYQNYASPAEIRQLIASDPNKAKEYGLVPSEGVRQSMSIDELRRQFPDVPEDQLRAISLKYLDEGGNFYSKLYGNYANQAYTTGQQNQAWKMQNAIYDEANKATEAEKKYTTAAADQFLKPKGDGISPSVKGDLSTTNPYKQEKSPIKVTQSGGSTPTYTQPKPSTPAPTQSSYTPAPYQAPASTPKALTNLSGFSAGITPAKQTMPTSLSGVSLGGTTPTQQTNPFLQNTTKPAAAPVTGQKSGGIGDIFKGIGTGINNLLNYRIKF